MSGYAPLHYICSDQPISAVGKYYTHNSISLLYFQFLGSVADVVSTFAADQNYEEDRRRRRTRENSEFGNVIDGLAYGVVGGFTSVFSQTFNGAKKNGPSGLVTGFGKGVVGAVVKPVTGELSVNTSH